MSFSGFHTSSLIINSDADRQILLNITSNPNALQKLRTLEVHLNAEFSAQQEEKLATAFNLLRPRPNGSNPHVLKAIKIVVHGTILYTCYMYLDIGTPAQIYVRT
jgi:hypothetical protein